MIKVPFWEQFRIPMFRGDKTMTTRSKKYGEQGDVFEAFGAVWEIICVKKLPIGVVAEEFYDSEGFDTKEDFIELWKKIHPKVGFQPTREYWVHLFRFKMSCNKREMENKK